MPNNTSDKIITLCSKNWAIIGVEFTFLGGKSECEGCKVKKVCLKLREGGKYRIVGLRDGAVQQCQLHDDGVIAVEVVEMPIMVAVDSKMAVEGLKITLKGNCHNIDCAHYNVCNPIEFKDNHFIVEKVIGDAINCRIGRQLKLVELKRVDE